MLRALIIGACLSVPIFMGVTASFPLDPALGSTDRYDRHYRVAGAIPFLTSYLLFTPAHLEPGRTYPLVLALHGGYKRSVGAFLAARADFQDRHRSFVLMPMALLSEPWVETGPGGRGLAPTRSLRLALDILRRVMAKDPIDPRRVYVTGSSNGAVGTFAALIHDRDLFAAGVAVNGAWPRQGAAAFKGARLAIYHGTEDRLSSVAGMRDLVAAIRRAGGDPKFVEMKGVGHDSWAAYERQDLWRWLFSQQRDP
ncbi:MAG: prolyl oligopeptidase family serine peptidase [Alphaproteobacteria bacterium]|nr:prolyl oligopeptidase family serine peptidase [Alphaproteobacteria bacterium]